MKIKFGADSKLNSDEYMVFTNPSKKYEWKNINRILLKSGETINVIDVKTENNRLLNLDDIVSLQSEERRCNIVTKDNKMYLLNTRLKTFEEKNTNNDFIKINNGTIINLEYIKEFKALENSRLEVILVNDTKYLVSRYYIKKFKERLL